MESEAISQAETDVKRRRPARAGGDEPPGFADWPGRLNLTNRLQKLAFRVTSRLTDRFPSAGSRILDLTVRPLVAHPLLAFIGIRNNKKALQNVRAFRRFLVIPDIHIGDAVMSQSVLSALRDFFPQAHVDYVVNRTAYPLIEGNPEASRVLPLFSNSAFPSAEALAALGKMIRAGRYDAVLNYCPYISDRDMGLDGIRMFNIVNCAPVVLQNERRHSEVNHFSFQMYRLTREWLSGAAEPLRPERFRGLRLTIDDGAIAEAGRFASQAGIRPGEPVIMYNPDAASPFTRMPMHAQAALLASLARLGTLLLVGAGHTQAGIGQTLVTSLSPGLRSRAKIVPVSLSLAAYAALIDLCDIFVTGDTGPLHLAAARKHSRSGGHRFRNRTAVLSFFGATPSRMSGYDSCRPGYLAAEQDAPSRAYAAVSRCRNCTCVNKSFKTCRVVRCFEQVDVESLAGWAAAYLETLRRRPSERREPAAA
jgi:ADP-heptose:LPS heptosyltransferase